jgi:Galactose oxidase, central domain
MSVLSPKRVLFSVVATAVLATSAFASNPSPRGYPRMVFDAQTGEIVLFGGTSAYDKGTQRSYDSAETWVWNGTRWVQRYPAHNPPARAAHAMTYDSIRGRIIMFGGRQLKGQATPSTDIEPIQVINDTWIYDNNDWTQLDPPFSPPARMLAGMAFDSVRDRVVLYGGTSVAADGFTGSPLYDSWEFDGTTWKQIDNESVKVGRPILAFDKARNQMILMGVDTSFKTKMYRLDTATSKWVEITPEKLPDCVNEGAVVYQEHNQTLMATGGVCSVTQSFNDQTWEWNGTTWTEIKTSMVLGRGTGMALAYDSLRQYALIYGGTDMLETEPRSTTHIYGAKNWRFAFTAVRPTARSLFTLTGDPGNNAVWMMGGLNEYSAGYESDFWGYRGGQWFRSTAKDLPTNCDAPVAAFDTDRSKLILACWPATSINIEMYEFDGTAFKNIATTKKKPEARRQPAMVYDQSLKKIVLFGGYDGSNFRDDTWTWNGTDWTEVKKDKPPNRSLHAMWYDPLQKKTIIYGGVGRENIDEKVKRFNDMWAFNGTGWTKLNPSSNPGERLGPQYAVDPNTGKLLLFGGLKSEVTNEDKDIRIQYYDNETWEWNGAANTWTKLSPATSPTPRENGRLVYDPVAGKLMLFGGFGGFFFGDVWYWTGSNWEVRPDVGSDRRRSSGPAPAPAPPTGD